MAESLPHGYRPKRNPVIVLYPWLNPVWHHMLYNCTHMATVGVKGLMTITKTKTEMLLKTKTI